VTRALLPVLALGLIAVVVALAAFFTKPRANFCPVHLEQGIYVTLVDGACVLCTFPEIRR
jgi:hypothetical protein